MSKITAWQSTDQRIFTERPAFVAHQAWLDLRSLIAGADIETADSVEEAVARHLIEHRDEAIALLRKADEAT